MILRIGPYPILKNIQCSHFLKTILSILNWLISRVKIMIRDNSYNSIFDAINTMMIYPSALCVFIYPFLVFKYVY